jgi:23S rRNA (uracil-5-)-methyltransferase RumA
MMVEFQKIVGEGKAMGYVDGRACFVAGPLPGETARVAVRRSGARFVEAELVELVTQSPQRQAAAEAHYRLCSPWQGVAYDYQLELKRGMLAEIMGRPELELKLGEVVAAPQSLGYRNKLEFAVMPGPSAGLQLALHARGSSDRLEPSPDGCVLGSAAMNAAARAVLVRLEQIDAAGEVATIMVRQAGGKAGGCTVVVGLRRRVKRAWSSLQGPEVAGVVVAVARPGHRYETVWQAGKTRLTETVGGVAVDYDYAGFFQVNVPVFEGALRQITAAVPSGSAVVDLYGGAGAIGLAVAARCGARVTGVEIDAAAVQLSNQSAARAGLQNYRAVATAAERLDPALLAQAEVVIVDPPRAGLDRCVVQALLTAGPQRIVYLSCNSVTQARDIMALQRHYQAGPLTGFDFYPGTLHMESLVVLDRR